MNMEIHANGPDDELGRVLAIITKLARLSSGENFIYRGEPERDSLKSLRASIASTRKLRLKISI